MITPVETDFAIFLYDAGEKNMIASALRYGEKNQTAEKLDFKVIFFGSSTASMKDPPFSLYPSKIIHYKTLGISEEVGADWSRGATLSKESLKALRAHLIVREKVWTGVSSDIFSQILSLYQENPTLEVACLRDNPSPVGDTDYFPIAKRVQSFANKVLIPSTAIIDSLEGKIISIIGHAPIEEWANNAKKVNIEALFQKLELDPHLPTITYAGGYGEEYEACFKQFLSLIPDAELQVIIAPHPKFKGKVEKELVERYSWSKTIVRIVGMWEEIEKNKANTMEAVSFANLVVCADPTSTVIFQANAIGKKVVLINLLPTLTGEIIASKGLLSRVETFEELQSAYSSLAENSIDPFPLMGIPREGDRLLWEEFATN